MLNTPSRIASIAMVSLLSVGTAFGQAEPISLNGNVFNIDMQQAYIQGSGKAINVYKLPVTNVTTGQVQYYDLTLSFGLQADGSLGLAPLSAVRQTIPQVLQSQNFKTGQYKGADGTVFELTGPVLEGGRNKYTLNSLTAGKSYTATVYTGLAKGNPAVDSRDQDSFQDGPAYGITHYNPSRLGFGVGYAYDLGYYVSLSVISENKLLFQRTAGGGFTLEKL